jgi:hypothetical protein
MRSRRNAAVAACPLLLVLLAAGKKDARLDSPVGADAVWQPAAQFIEGVRKTCGRDCFVQQMASAAPPAAVEFTKSIHGEGWLRDFRKVARVDIAWVEYPFRANENQGWLLVNGTPPLVDVDNLQKLPKSQMEENPAWSKLIAQSPRATLFPGDRTSTIDPVAIVYPDGSQQFVVAYKVLDGCHACAQLGVAFLAWEFNPKGKLTETEFLDVVPPPSAGAPARPIHIHAGQMFTLALKADAKHEWTLAQAPARWILRSVSQTTSKETSTVSWIFEAISNGSTQMTLGCSSGESLVLRIIAAPGLGH